MNKLLRFAGSIAMITTLFGAAFTLGCASEETEEDEASSEQDITGSLANAQACAVRDTYVRAGVGDFYTVAEGDLPFAWNLPPNAARPLFARLEVRGIGAVYYIEYTWANDGGPTSVQGFFHDSSGRLVLRSVSNPTQSTFFNLGGGVLACGGGSSSSSGGWADGGWGTSSSGWVPDGGHSSSGAIPDGGHWVTDAGFGHD